MTRTEKLGAKAVTSLYVAAAGKKKEGELRIWGISRQAIEISMLGAYNFAAQKRWFSEESRHSF
jgi:hypothetical protein